MAVLPINHIHSTPGYRGGKPRIARMGITVEFLSLFTNNPEWPVEKIAEEYSLTPGEIYAAWSYYYDHKEEMVEKMNIPHISEFPGYAEYMEKHKQTEK